MITNGALNVILVCLSWNCDYSVADQYGREIEIIIGVIIFQSEHKTGVKYKLLATIQPRPFL